MAATPSLLELAARISGRVVTDADPDWDDVRHGFNLTIDVRPAAVVLPADAADVLTTVRHARSHGFHVAAQATGHNSAAHHTLADTLLVDLRRLRSVAVDVGRRRVRVGAGVRWQDVVPMLSEHGLAALHGSSPLVGIAGYSLGGGMGWLARKHGLQANSVRALELVTADARLVRVDAHHRPDLFWALRGGNGNFGVVTAIEFDVYAIEELYAGALFFPPDRTREVMDAWTRITPELPEETMTWVQLMQLPDVPFVPEQLRGQDWTVFLAAHLGGPEEGRALLRQVRDLGPSLDTFGSVPPVGLAELAMDPLEPVPYASTTALVDGLPPEALDALLAAVGPGSGSPLPLVQVRHLGGALARTADGAGARATLPGEFCVYVLGVVTGEESAATTASYLAAARSALAPYRVGEYPNFVEEPAEASTFFDPGTWERLRLVKAQHDPGDLFRGNHRIQPMAVEDAAAPVA